MTLWSEDCLNELLETDTLVGLYKDKERPSRFLSGWITALDVQNGWLMMALLDHHGGDDGFLLLPLSRVFRIETGGLDLERMRILHGPGSKPTPPVSPGDDLLKEVLEHLRETKAVCALGSQDVDDMLTGFLEQTGPQACRIRTVHHLFGYSHGVTWLERGELDLVEWGSRDCRDLATILQVHAQGLAGKTEG